jgi:muramoyltetrapeptide carboxypeptidase
MNLLNKEDEVAIVAPAGRFDEDKLKFGIEIFEKWGLTVKLSPNLNKGFGKFSATDKERLEDLQWALDEPNIKAIFCARGGYGAIRIVDQLDFTKFIKKPKWIVGFSDITVLLNHISTKFNIPTVHGPMPASFIDNSKEALQALHNLVFEGSFEITFEQSKFNNSTQFNGELMGGNLSIVHSLIGSEITKEQLRDKILFIEEVDEYLYHIERMMFSLKRSGVLGSLSGLLVGNFSKVKDNETPFDKDIHEIISGICNSVETPVIFDVPSGHFENNMPLPIGSNIQVQSKKNRVKLLWSNPI